VKRLKGDNGSSSLFMRQNKISTPLFLYGGGGKYPLQLFFNGPNTQEFNKSDKTTVYKLIILLCAGLFCDVFLGQMLFSSLFLSSSRGKLVGLGKHTHALKLELATDGAKIAPGRKFMIVNAIRSGACVFTSLCQT